MNTDSLPVVGLSPENLSSLQEPGLTPKEPGTAGGARGQKAATAHDGESMEPCYKLHPLVLHILYAHGKLTLHHREDGSGYFDQAEVRALEELAGT